MPCNTIIIADARTGSNLLGYALDGHDEINYGDEILSESVFVINDYCKKWYINHGIHINRLPRISSEMREVVASPEYIDYVTKEYNLFKLLYYHIKNSRLIEYICSGIFKIIHLKRKSVIDKCISLLVAQRDDGFLYWKKPIKKRPIHIKIETLNSMINTMIVNEQSWSERLKNIAVLNIYYEDMVDNWDETIELCLDFMNLEHQKLPKTTFKAISCKNIDLVENRQEVINWAISNGYRI